MFWNITLVVLDGLDAVKQLPKGSLSLWSSISPDRVDCRIGGLEVVVVVFWLVADLAFRMVGFCLVDLIWPLRILFHCLALLS